MTPGTHITEAHTIMNTIVGDTYVGLSNSDNAVGSAVRGVLGASVDAGTVAEMVGNPEVSAVAGAVTALHTAEIESGRNLTAEWFRDHYATVRPRFIAYLAARLPMSVSLGVVEDHVAEWVAKAIQKDVLRAHLQGGETVNPSALQVWCMQAAVSEIRGWGTDASLRSSRGARTTRERAGAVTSAHREDSVGVALSGEAGSDSETRDYYDRHSESVEETIDRDQRAEVIRAAIRARFREADRGYALAVFNGLMEGSTVADIANTTGLDPDRVKSFFPKFRALVTTPSVRRAL